MHKLATSDIYELYCKIYFCNDMIFVNIAHTDKNSRSMVVVAFCVSIFYVDSVLYNSPSSAGPATIRDNATVLAYVKHWTLSTDNVECKFKYALSRSKEFYAITNL